MCERLQSAELSIVSAQRRPEVLGYIVPRYCGHDVCRFSSLRVIRSSGTDLEAFYALALRLRNHLH